jgi:hypothetical protein
VIPFLVALAVAGCSSVPRQWEKPGADRETAKQDLKECRRAAANEAWSGYPDLASVRTPLSSSATPYGRSDPYYSRRDRDRTLNESRLTGSCMQNRGYEMNRAPTNIIPTSPLR